MITSIVGKVEDKLSQLNDNSIFTVTDLAMADPSNVAAILGVALFVATKYISKAGTLMQSLQSEVEYREKIFLQENPAEPNLEILTAISYSMVDGETALGLLSDDYKNLHDLILDIETNSIPSSLTDEGASSIGEIAPTTGESLDVIYSNDEIYRMTGAWTDDISLDTEGATYDLLVCENGIADDNARIAMLWRHLLKKGGRGLVYVNDRYDQGYYPKFERTSTVYYGQELVVDESEVYVVDENDQLTTANNGERYIIYRTMP